MKKFFFLSMLLSGALGWSGGIAFAANLGHQGGAQITIVNNCPSLTGYIEFSLQGKPYGTQCWYASSNQKIYENGSYTFADKGKLDPDCNYLLTTDLWEIVSVSLKDHKATSATVTFDGSCNSSVAYQ